MNALLPTEMIVDLFAGGGGASQGIFHATGRHPDIAVNHDATAVAIHAENHPDTFHHCASVWVVEPRAAVAGRPVGLLWASPDCRHFSRAAGGRPKWKSVRSLPGVVLTWATRVRPRVIVVENVREMIGWGPLLDDGTPDPARIGRSFNGWVGRLRGLGYQVQWRELCAADFGAPTIRTRLVVVARCDGEPITWPHPTHARRPSLLEFPWRTAAECIDWRIPCPSIFTRARPLAEATLRRVAEGVRRYVLGTADPFIVSLTHQGGFRGQGLGEPLATVTSAHRGEKALVAPVLATLKGTSVAADATAPLGTVCATGTHHALVAATLATLDHQSSSNATAPATAPLTTITGKARHLLVAAFLAQHNGGNIARDLREPVSTLTTSAAQQQVVQASLSAENEAGARRVAAFLMSYYGSGGQHQDLRAPLGAVTTRDRFALVTVDGVDLPIVDIGMRMLCPAELTRAQGFPAGYVLDRRADGVPVTKTQQVRLIGNSVCPDMAAAVVLAQFGVALDARLAA